ncbi:disease resistance protein RPV1-like [Aphidius gifuensis]|uniref:disease resistance protein RPV1-like n=1 Tax=Aphidius gifuensis TaxID=684658 RepID=UPI001CDBA583|nr:disease resistance protein RPV1-like [Aphidius gifuensis]
METYKFETQWLEKLASTSQEFQAENASFYDGSRKEKVTTHNERMMKLSPLFASQPKFEKVCNDEKNKLVHSGFTSYLITVQSNHTSKDLNELHKLADDLKYIVNFWGHNLTELIIIGYTFSKILPTIKITCPNLKILNLAFEEIEIKDFENVFSNMSHLEELTIDWKCENLPLPTILVESIEQVGGTLKSLELANFAKTNDRRLPDSFVSVFPRLIVLEYLSLHGFGDLNQALIQSISEIKSLVSLSLVPVWVEDLECNMYPIGNLKNLERLNIRTDCGVTDEFLINLSNNAKNLKKLAIFATNITDKGIMALNKFTQLEILDLNSRLSQKNNEFITDQSVEYLISNQQLEMLDISNCIKITDSSVLKLVKNIKYLRDLYLKETSLTVELAKKLRDITDTTEIRETSLLVHVPIEKKNSDNDTSENAP